MLPTVQVSISCVTSKWYTYKNTELSYFVSFQYCSVKICFIKRGYSHYAKRAFQKIKRYLEFLFLANLEIRILEGAPNYDAVSPSFFYVSKGKSSCFQVDLVMCVQN